MGRQLGCGTYLIDVDFRFCSVLLVSFKVAPSIFTPTWKMLRVVQTPQKLEHMRLCHKYDKAYCTSKGPCCTSEFLYNRFLLTLLMVNMRYLVKRLYMNNPQRHDKIWENENFCVCARMRFYNRHPMAMSEIDNDPFLSLPSFWKTPKMHARLCDIRCVSAVTLKFRYLITYDCVTFHRYLLSIRASSATARSLWLLTRVANKMYTVRTAYDNVCYFFVLDSYHPRVVQSHWARYFVCSDKPRFYSLNSTIDSVRSVPVPPGLYPLDYLFDQNECALLRSVSKVCRYVFVRVSCQDRWTCSSRFRKVATLLFCLPEADTGIWHAK